MGFKDFIVDNTDVVSEEVIKIDGKKYKVARKTANRIEVTRYYWFDALVDKYLRRAN